MSIILKLCRAVALQVCSGYVQDSAGDMNGHGSTTIIMAFGSQLSVLDSAVDQHSPSCAGCIDRTMCCDVEGRSKDKRGRMKSESIHNADASPRCGFHSHEQQHRTFLSIFPSYIQHHHAVHSLLHATNCNFETRYWQAPLTSIWLRDAPIHLGLMPLRQRRLLGRSS